MYRYLHLLLSVLVLSWFFTGDASAQAPTCENSSPENSEEIWKDVHSTSDSTGHRHEALCALRAFASKGAINRIDAALEKVPPDSDLWPQAIAYTEEAYRVSSERVTYRAGYLPLLKKLQNRVTDPTGWLAVMIRLGDYYWTVERDRWKALSLYEEAYRVGGNQRLVADLRERLRDVRIRDNGSEAPPFRIRSMSGKMIDLAEFRGRPVLLYFWAYWCAPCLAEIPKLNRLYTRHQDEGLVVLGLVDEPTDRERVVQFLQKQDVQWPQAVRSDWTGEGRSPARLYGVAGQGPPFDTGFKVLIDREGRIGATGYELDHVRSAIQEMFSVPE